MRDGTSLLSAEGVVTGYGKMQVVNGVTLCVAKDEIVALIGHNGAGKSTLLKALFGLLDIWQGSVISVGVPSSTLKPAALLRLGVGYVPQGNRVIADLSVRENLELADMILHDRALVNKGIERALALFPPLRSRLHQQAGSLSGGEKQMLAMANSLVLSPRLLLLDEPTLGLAPLMIAEVLGTIKQYSRDSGVGVLIVEQRVREVLKIADRVYVLRNGTVTYAGDAETLYDDRRLREVYL